MNWDAIGAIGQAVSALALIVVIVQFRHARLDSRRALSQVRAEALRDQLIQERDERTMRTIFKANAALGVDLRDRFKFLAALMDQAGLTEEEAFLMHIRQMSAWSLRLQNIPNVHDLPAAERGDFDRGIRSTYGQPGMGRIFLETFIKPTQHPDAVRYVENVLAHPR